MLGSTLLGERRKPRNGEVLLLVADHHQGNGLGGRVNGDVGGQEMATAGEAILVDDRNIVVYDSHGHKALALIEDLDAQGRRLLRSQAVDDGAGRGLALAERHLDIHNGLELGEEIRDDGELLDTLLDDAVGESTPLLLGQVAVHGLVHVACDA